MDENNEARLVRELSYSDVLGMMAHLVRVPELYRAYCDSIKPEHFKQEAKETPSDETDLMCLWGGLCLFYKEQDSDSHITQALLLLYVQRFMNEYNIPLTYMDEMASDDPEESICAYIFDPSLASYNYLSGEPLCKQFVTERVVVNSLVKHVNSLRERAGTVDLGEAASLARLSDEAQRIEGISARIDLEPIAPELDYFNSAKKEEVIPSGIPYIDSRLNGGQHYGEVNGLLGPTGAGKTTMGAMLFTSNVKKAFEDEQKGLEARNCVFYTFEQSKTDVMMKVISNAADIARSSLSGSLDRLTSTLSNNKDIPLKEYEAGRFAGLSEVERYYANNVWLNKNGLIRNFSGVADACDDTRARQLKRNKGRGGINELISDLHYIRDTTGKGIRVVFIDYVGLVMERQAEISDDPKKIYYALKRFGDEVRQRIAGDFNCCVWLLHQMSGAANSKSPCIPLDHSDAEGCKSLVNNMANCLCLGTPDSGDENSGRHLYLSFSKTRNSGSSGFSDRNRIMEHDTVFARMNDVSNNYIPDRPNKCFKATEGISYF